MGKSTRAIVALAAIVSVGWAATAQAPPVDQTYDTQAYLFASARSGDATYETDAPTSRRVTSGNKSIACTHAASRRIAFSGDASVDHLGVAWVGPDCNSDSRIVVVLSTREGDHSTTPIYIKENASALVSLFGKPPFGSQIDASLRAIIAGDPFPAGRLPEWEAEHVTPALANGLIYATGAEQTLYEAIRKQNRKVWCFQPNQNALRCFAFAPGRTHAIEVLNLIGFDPYDTRNANDARDVLIGARPQMTDSEIRGWNVARGRSLAKELGFVSPPADDPV